MSIISIRISLGRLLIFQEILFPINNAGLVKKQQAMQQEQLARDADVEQLPEKRPVQTGERAQPAQLPPEMLDKPGIEADMALKPNSCAPQYLGSDKLKDKVAIITGGDSGIGRAVATLFAREGADVVILYLCEHEDAAETAKRVQAEGRRCLTIAGDVCDSAFCERAVQQALESMGRIDILVNNAAFQLHAEGLEQLSDERIDLTFRTNIYGYFYMARAVVPHLQEGSAIINTGSVTGLEGSERLLDYASTKGAIHAFTKSLASNLIGKGIRVNAVAPGPVWTPLNPADKPPQEVAEFGKKTDYHRPAQPEEIAPAYVFLASGITSPYVHGIVLPITGTVGAI